jgi:4-amino-4-deoxy-L-arabinose transferase-like glycosyltransferase
VPASAAAGVVLCIALRLPWFDSALGRDEAGVSMVAQAWHHSHPFPYGPYFLDRPPLLVLAYRLAGDPTGVRVLGMLAACIAVVVCTLLAARVAGRRAALPAALLTAGFTSSALLTSVFTPAELLASVPSAASVLLLLSGLTRESAWRLAAAGAAAASALLIKQSFGDALVAGIAGLALAGWHTPLRRTAARAGAYAAGIGAVSVGVLAWDLSMHLSPRAPTSLLYAFAGFRLDAVKPLANGNVAQKLSTIATAALGSGLALAFVVAIAGLITLRRRRVTAGVLAAWLLAGLFGVLGGGSYWAHYLIELVPVSVVGVATLVAWRPRIGAALCAAAMAIGLATSLDQAALGRPQQYQRGAVTLGHYLRDRALPGDTAYVLYAKVNALYYSGLPSPFPYHWSLMMMSVPGVQQQLRALLASPRRPTWIVMADTTHTFGLDRTGQTKRVLKRNYRLAARICGIRVLLARGSGPRPNVPFNEPCQILTPDTVDIDF